GFLSMDPNGRVHRRLDWADFDDGSVNLLAPVDLPTAAPAGGTTAVPASSPRPLARDTWRAARRPKRWPWPRCRRRA
ncbi:MAG TPA: hypothetical protein VGH71_00620, partial [Gammaproteobacteria bacterium]